jgi:hypothetical protein
MLGSQAGQRIFHVNNWKILSVEGLRITGQLGDGRSVIVQLKNYAMEPHTLFGAITGMDESELARMQSLKALHDAAIVLFLDCVIGIWYWATLGQLLERAGEFEDINGRVHTVPFGRFKHGQADPDHIQQWLWPLLWFKLNGQWGPLTDLEIEAMRCCRTPRTATGIARLGHEDQERHQFETFEQAWFARKSQGSLF